jgi:tetratricopeptide (TPR) repeat protein
LVVGEVEDGAAFIDEALILNPNLALGWLLSGWVNIYLGNPEVAIERAMRAVRLSPLDPFTFLAFSQIGAGHFYAGRYDEASSWAEKGLRQQPNSAGTARVAAASHALAGRVDQAQKAMARLREMDPTLRVSDAKGGVAGVTAGTCQIPHRCHAFLWLAADRRSPAVQHEGGE